MEDNLKSPEVPATPNIGQPIPNIVQPKVSQQPSGEGDNKMMLWLVGGVLVILLLVGGIYYYLSSKQKTDQQSMYPKNTPATKAQENLENDLDSVSLNDADQEFSSVDKDLQSL